jgi:hypothetical protein
MAGFALASTILKADPDTKIPWNEVETGYWVAQCVCEKEYHRDPIADRRVRLDPLDPKTSRHAGECESDYWRSFLACQK